MSEKYEELEKGTTELKEYFGTIELDNALEQLIFCGVSLITNELKLLRLDIQKTQKSEVL